MKRPILIAAFAAAIGAMVMTTSAAPIHGGKPMSNYHKPADAELKK